MFALVLVAAAIVLSTFVTMLLLAGASGWMLVRYLLVSTSTAVVVLGLAVAAIAQ